MQHWAAQPNSAGYTSCWLRARAFCRRNSESPTTRSGCEVYFCCGGLCCYWEWRPTYGGTSHISSGNEIIGSWQHEVFFRHDGINFRRLSLHRGTRSTSNKISEIRAKEMAMAEYQMTLVDRER